MKLKKFTLLLCFIVPVIAQAQLPFYVPTTDLVGWWPFTGNAKDLSGNSNDLTVNGATLAKDRNGNTNAAYVFNGTSDYLENSALSHTFTATSPFTISTWIKKTSTDAGVAIMSGTTTDAYFIWLVQGGSAEMSFGTNKQNSAWFYAKTGFNVDDWDHYVGVYKGDSMKFYKNSKLVATNYFNYGKVLSGSLPLFVGKGVSGNFFTGVIDDIGLWKRALTDKEIRLLYTTKCESQITFQPTDQYGKIQGAAKFTVTAKADTFLWQLNGSSGFQTIKNGVKYGGATTKTLNVFNLTMANHNQEFRSVVASNGCYDTSNVVKLHVCGEIKRNPVSQSVFFGDNATFSIFSNDASATFQWQVNSGSGYSNISDGGQYIGTTNDTLKIQNVKLLNNDQLYRCVVYQGSCIDTSLSAKLLVCGKITGNPSNQEVKIPNDASFTVQSSDNSASYLWQINTGSGFKNLANGGQISGANTKNLKILKCDISINTNAYRCVVRHGGCTDTSAVATLTVCGVITLQPQNSVSYSGETAKFVAKSNDSKATYAWQTNTGFGFYNLTNSSQFEGVTTDTLKMNDVSSFNNNQMFRCIVQHGNCSDTTSLAKLSVCGKIILQAKDQSVKIGKTAQYEVSSNDQFATYQWQQQLSAGFSNISNSGQFSGTTTSKLTVTNADMANDGQLFRCVIVHGSCSDTAKAARLSVCGEIITQPSNLEVNSGTIAQFTAISNDKTAMYQWQILQGSQYQDLSNSGQYSGVTTQTLLITGTTMANNTQQYRCKIISGSCTDNSTLATLTVINKSGAVKGLTANLLTVYPNPGDGIFELTVNSKLLGAPFYIYDAYGKMLFSGKLHSAEQMVDIQHFSTGIYLLKVDHPLGGALRIHKW